MGLAPSEIRVQYYAPEEEDLFIGRGVFINEAKGLEAARELPSKDAIRLILCGDGFGWKLPPGAEKRFGSIEYSGDDEYKVFDDDDEYLYVAILNPAGDDRRVVLESICTKTGHSDCGRRTRAFMTLEAINKIVPQGAITFVGVQVPDEDARKLGLL